MRNKDSSAGKRTEGKAARQINQQEQMKIKNGLSLSLRVRVEF